MERVNALQSTRGQGFVTDMDGLMVCSSHKQGTGPSTLYIVPA